MCFSKQLVKMKFVMLLALLLLCYGVGNIHCVHENSTDLHALLDFKHGVTSDPNGVLSTWNTSIHYCRWRGVNCTRTGPWRVSMLNLTGQSLAGEIATSLANLTQLNALDLSYNLFSGQLPPLDGLQLLQILYLNDNSLAGSIPDALTNCSNLVQLDLHHNQLSGVIPPKIGVLSNLEYLDLFSNNLSGMIPPTFANLTRLSLCRLKVNHLEGSIPDGIWQLPNMKQLVLGDNSLSGMIPAAINMSLLTHLGLENNMLGKALPSNFGDALHSLEVISLNTNMFQGPIPASLGNSSSLQLIDLSVNHFTGQVPASLGKLSSLNLLNLEQNQLETGKGQSWEFLHSLSNCRDLDTLSLFDNRLQGVIPDSVCNLSTRLEFLILGKNYISGVVPTTIGNLSNLLKLGLSDNNLSGSIGEWIGNINRLQGLSLHGNSFTGPIPSSIGNLTELTVLLLQNNEFEAPIPPSLEYMSQLSVLNLSYNNLQGNIPLGVGNLTQLFELHLSSNKLTGGIPDSLGQCHNLETIKMDKNFLTGDIPPSFSNLKDLGLLNLSHNNLSGSIPMALNNLSLLYKLDLSYNDLQGEIPRNGVFANATAIYLNNNWRLCGGVMDLHMPVCPAVTRRKEWKPYLIVLPILLFAFMTLGMSIYIIFLGKKTSRKPYLLLLSFGKKFPRVCYNDLSQVTGNFSESNLIGRGSYGSVYIGKLTKAKIQVAIKVFDLGIRFADRSFVSECEALRTVRHRNLLPILTACSTIDNNGNDFKALIYEFMANGNLDIWLHQRHGRAAPEFLGLAHRISICIDVADALAYLHHDCGRPIVHCDLKPTNILLDDDMNAHLGDFGIASLIFDSRSIAAGHSGHSSSLAVTGTIGYIAPEYAQTVHATTYGDVYSFGVVLLEMLIGKRPTDPMFEGELSIISFVERNFPDQVLDIIDAHVQEECKGFNKATAIENEAYRCVLSLLQVALACTLRLPRERMSMRETTINLHAIRKSYIAAIK